MMWLYLVVKTPAKEHVLINLNNIIDISFEELMKRIVIRDKNGITTTYELKEIESMQLIDEYYIVEIIKRLIEASKGDEHETQRNR